MSESGMYTSFYAQTRRNVKGSVKINLTGCSSEKKKKKGREFSTKGQNLMAMRLDALIEFKSYAGEYREYRNILIIPS